MLLPPSSPAFACSTATHTSLLPLPPLLLLTSPPPAAPAALPAPQVHQGLPPSLILQAPQLNPFKHCCSRNPAALPTPCPATLPTSYPAALPTPCPATLPAFCPASSRSRGRRGSRRSTPHSRHSQHPSSRCPGQQPGQQSAAGQQPRGSATAHAPPRPSGCGAGQGAAGPRGCRLSGPCRRARRGGYSAAQLLAPWLKSAAS
ncbi:hypothetical protein HaLaN_08396 [Haematococcus lacustris]|uniref:Uncharacterized protein n=1 Tax=Haematococcus lacustris TaxID=44745 RepID=A0A699Z142_HAELA|nr:hypothetical protein HaLaN_08396 [Haematococcus lacustris]